MKQELLPHVTDKETEVKETAQSYTQNHSPPGFKDHAFFTIFYIFVFLKGKEKKGVCVCIFLVYYSSYKVPILSKTPYYSNQAIFNV